MPLLPPRMPRRYPAAVAAVTLSVRLVTLASCATVPAQAAAAPWDPSPHNVVWNDLLPNAPSDPTWVNTMPVGNGDLAANVWADHGTGTVSLLLSQSRSWNEAAELSKVGLVNVTFAPNPFVAGGGAFFQQTLDLPTGTVQFLLGGSSATNYALMADVWIDAGGSNVAVVTATLGPAAQQGSDATAFSMTATWVNVRPAPQTITPAFACRAYNVSADATAGGSTVTFYHRNANTEYFANTLAELNYPTAAQEPGISDPLINRTTGGTLFGSAGATVDVDRSSVSSAVPGSVGVAVLTAQAASLQQWVSQVEALAAKGVPSRSTHDAWWSAFWDRSHIEVSSDAVVSRQFALQRFVQATQGRGGYSIKFNGMLYTANRPSVTNGGVDYRQWGGHQWWQNARLPYYNLLAAGDGESLVESLFVEYNASLALARARTRIYYPRFTAGAPAFWSEYTSLFGSTHAGSYGCNRAGTTSPPIWYSDDRWNHYNTQGGLDLSLLILDHYAYTGDVTTLQGLLPVVASVIDYYSQYWSDVDPTTGKVVMFPTQSCETWQCPGYPPDPKNCPTNDAPTVAGLLAVIPRVLALPPSLLPPGTNMTRWQQFLATVPDVPVVSSVLQPCEKCPPKTSNVENTELYPVHPYRLYTVAKSPAVDLSPALAAFAKKRFTSDSGWNQNAMDAALLGLASQAQAYVTARANTAPASGYRFPAFMPHEQDYEPSADHLAVFNNALTYMVIQPADDAAQGAVLLPAWPCAWDVDFKVHAPANTIVSGSLVNGTLTYTVDPPSRKSAITANACQ